MNPTTTIPDPLAHALILDELFDLNLYIELRKVAKGDLARILGELIPIETEHAAFWKKFFHLNSITELNTGRKWKLKIIVLACRIFGSVGIRMVLEAIEIYGIRKYLAVWERYKDQPLGEAVRTILDDEFHHEDSIVSQSSGPTITPKTIQSIFLGFNDGLTEILGAVSGFFAAFQHTSMVLMAGFTVAVAGSISMAAGAFVAGSAEREVEMIERGKNKFYGKASAHEETEAHPLRLAAIVGVSYFLGAMIPVSPVIFGAKSPLIPIITAGLMIILVSLVLAFLSGMNIKKRIMMNLLIITGAVGISYAIGILVKTVWGIQI